MKLASAALSILLATGGHVHASPLSALGSQNITTSSTCQDYSDSLQKLEEELSSSSSTCKIDVSDEGDNVQPAAGDSSWYNAYSEVCDRICGCPSSSGGTGRKLQNEDLSETTFKATGQCDAVMDAITAISSALDSQSDCITSSFIRPRNLICRAPSGGSCSQYLVSICAGYYRDSCPCPSVCKCLFAVEDNGDRMLKEMDNMSTEEILEEVRRHGANPNGVYAKKELFPQDVCAKAAEFMDKQDEDDFYIPSQYHGKMKDRLLTGKEFVQVFGKEHSKNLLDFFHDSLGYKAPVTDITIHRTTVDKVSYFTSHTDHDHGDSMLVFLKPSEGVIHYTGEGLLVTEKATPGMAIVHGKDVLHKSLPFSGSRDVLEISSDPDANERTKCMLLDIVY